LKRYFSSYWVHSAFYSFLQRFSITLFGFVNFILLIRGGLEKQQMGIWALFLVVTTLFETTKGSLIKNAQIKFVAGSKDEEKAAITSSAFVLNVSVSFIFICLLYLFADDLGTLLHAGDELERMLLWFIPGVLAVIMFSHLEAVSQSHFDFKGVFAGYFTRQMLFFSIIVFHRINGIPISLVNLSLYFSISILCGAVVMYLYTRKYLYYKFVPSKEWISKILGFGGYIFGIGVLANIFASIDQLLIAKVNKRPDDVASYNAATRINGLIDIPSYAAADILLPKVARIVSDEGLEKMRYIYERMVGILLSFTIPASLFIIAFPNFVISVIAGSAYQSSALILQLYMIAGIMRPAQNQAANMLMSIGKARLCFIINAYYLAGTLAINYTCLRLLGFYGPAVGTVISCLLGLIVWFAVIRHHLGVEFRNIPGYILSTYKTLFRQAKMLFTKKENSDVAITSEQANGKEHQFRVAHLVLAHKNPRQLQRMIEALRHPAFDFYIHIDSKSDMEQFRFLEKEPDVFFVERRARVNWAGYGMVQATVNGLEQIVEKKYDYINLLSAQDFPIKSPEQIYQFLKERKGTEFITCERLETEWTEARVRVENYHFVNWNIPGKIRLEKLADSVLPRRKFPLNYELVGRSQWFTITGDAAVYLLSFLKNNPRVVTFFKYTWAADELIFATILHNSAFRNRIQENLMYVDWTGCVTGHPRILEMEDLPKLLESEKMFARKFDADLDPQVISAIEQHIQQVGVDEPVK